MKRDQIVKIYSIIVFLLCMCVPWAATRTNGYGMSIYQDHGYSFVWNPPQISSQVDKARLIIPLVGVTALFGAAWYRSKE